MKTNRFRGALCLGAVAALISAPAAFAQVSFTGSYSQNFSSMGTGTIVPAGWSGYSESGDHGTFVPAGDYNVDTSSVQATSINPNFTAGTLTKSVTETLTPTQASSTGKGTDIVNWVNSSANISAGEGTRSLGTDPSGNAGTILELAMTNNTGSAINAVNIAYDIDRFTTISDTNGVPSGYLNSNVEEFPGYQLFYNLTPGAGTDGLNDSDWVNVSSLNPTINMGTVAGAVNVPNTVGITSVPTTTVSLASAWAAGATLGFAWFDDNGEAPSPDQEIGLNNVVISAVPEPGSGMLGLAALGVVFALLRLRKRA